VDSGLLFFRLHVQTVFEALIALKVLYLGAGEA
jgi:hypothetical protein